MQKNGTKRQRATKEYQSTVSSISGIPQWEEISQ
jgi:hypothetical protein